MRSRFVLALVAAALGAGVAIAGPFDDFRDDLLARRNAVARHGSPRYSALTRALRVKARTGLLCDQVEAGYKAARIAETRFRRDTAVEDAEGRLLAGLHAEVLADRDVLTARGGSLGDPDAEARLTLGLERANADLALVPEETDPFRALRPLRNAAKHLREAWPPHPDFGLPDVNPNSATSGQEVSPRDFAQQFSAHYFGAAT